MTLDILIPIYQPHEKWASEFIDHYHVLKSRLTPNLKVNLILVNDGSITDLEKDGAFISSHLAEASYYSYKENRGKGYALRYAAEKSQAEWIMYTDYDFPYTYDSMLNMLDKLMSGEFDAVVGKRDDSYYNHISPRRRRISQFLKKFNSLLFNLPTDDTQCGLKAFNAEARKTFLETTTDRYLIDVEFLKKLSSAKKRVGVQMVELRKGVVLSKISNLSLFKEMINYLRIMLSN